MENDTYCWLFDLNNSYDRGIAYQSEDNGSTWVDLEDPWQDPNYMHVDFCFKTYHTKPKNKAMDTPFLRFLENHPHLFPLLRQLLRL